MRPIDRIVPAAILGCLALPMLIGIALIYLAPFPRTGAEFAAWVQAAGTVAAIVATAGVAWWVPWSAARERRAGLKRTASYQLHACAQAIGQLKDSLAEQSNGASRLFRPVKSRIGYDLAHYRGVLSSFPLHEADSREATDCFLRMHNCLIRAEKVMESYNKSLGPGQDMSPYTFERGMGKIYDRAISIATEFDSGKLSTG